MAPKYRFSSKPASHRPPACNFQSSARRPAADTDTLHLTIPATNTTMCTKAMSTFLDGFGRISSASPGDAKEENLGEPCSHS